MKNLRLFLLFFLLSSLLLSGCAGLEIDGASQTILVNEDLSGTVSRAIAITPEMYRMVQNNYDVSDPSALLARELADSLYWSSYEWQHWTDSSHEWIEVTASFDDPDHLYFLGVALVAIFVRQRSRDFIFKQQPDAVDKTAHTG